jgi:hypothetical protein
MLPSYLTRADAGAHWNMCRDIPLAPTFTAENDSGAMAFPYGTIFSCRLVDRHTPLFGDPDFTATVVLTTAQGWVLLRVDYTGTDAGRRYVASAVELGVDDAADLLDDHDAQAVRGGLNTRGGPRQGVWVLHYGDG